MDGEGAGLFEDDPVDSVFEEHRAVRPGELSHRDGAALWCVTTEVHVTGDPVNRKALRVRGTCRERRGAVRQGEWKINYNSFFLVFPVIMEYLFCQCCFPVPIFIVSYNLTW